MAESEGSERARSETALGAVVSRAAVAKLDTLEISDSFGTSSEVLIAK